MNVVCEMCGFETMYCNLQVPHLILVPFSLKGYSREMICLVMLHYSNDLCNCKCVDCQQGIRCGSL